MHSDTHSANNTDIHRGTAVPATDNAAKVRASRHCEPHSFCFANACTYSFILFLPLTHSFTHSLTQCRVPWVTRASAHWVLPLLSFHSISTLICLPGNQGNEWFLITSRCLLSLVGYNYFPSIAHWIKHTLPSVASVTKLTEAYNLSWCPVLILCHKETLTTEN